MLCWVSQWVICKCYIYITLYSIFVSVILRNQLQIEFPNIHSGWCSKRNIDLLQRLFQHIRLLRSYTTTTLYQHPLDSQLMLLFLHHKGYNQQSIVWLPCITGHLVPMTCKERLCVIPLIYYLKININLSILKVIELTSNSISVPKEGCL